MDIPSYSVLLASYYKSNFTVCLKSDKPVYNMAACLLKLSCPYENTYDSSQYGKIYRKVLQTMVPRLMWAL